MLKKILIIDGCSSMRKELGYIIEKVFKKEFLESATTNIDKMLDSYIQKPDLTLISFEPDDEKEKTEALKLVKKHPDKLFVALCSTDNNSYHSYVRKHGFVGFINKNNFLNDFKETLNVLQFNEV